MALEDGRAAMRTTSDFASEKEKLLVHHKEKHFTADDVVRDVIIGISNSLTVPFALAAGLSSASTPSSSLPRRRPPPLIDAFRSLLQSPSPDAVAVREQAILSVTAIAVAALPSPLHPSDASHLESLVKLLLTVTNRPNHGPDRLSHALACQSLRELEHAHPLLSDVVGNLWALTQAKRTHATQSYLLLLLAAAVRNIALHGLLSPLPPSSPPPPPSFPSPSPNSFFPLPIPIVSRLISI